MEAQLSAWMVVTFPVCPVFHALIGRRGPYLAGTINFLSNDESGSKLPDSS
jgi:hypothetical protein